MVSEQFEQAIFDALSDEEVLDVMTDPRFVQPWQTYIFEVWYHWFRRRYTPIGITHLESLKEHAMQVFLLVKDVFDYDLSDDISWVEWKAMTPQQHINFVLLGGQVPYMPQWDDFPFSKRSMRIALWQDWVSLGDYGRAFYLYKGGLFPAFSPEGLELTVSFEYWNSLTLEQKLILIAAGFIPPPGETIVGEITPTLWDTFTPDEKQALMNLGVDSPNDEDFGATMESLWSQLSPEVKNTLLTGEGVSSLLWGVLSADEKATVLGSGSSMTQDLWSVLGDEEKEASGFNPATQSFASVSTISLENLWQALPAATRTEIISGGSLILSNDVWDIFSEEEQALWIDLGGLPPTPPTTEPASSAILFISASDDPDATEEELEGSGYEVYEPVPADSGRSGTVDIDEELPADESNGVVVVATYEAALTDEEKEIANVEEPATSQGDEESKLNPYSDIHRYGTPPEATSPYPHQPAELFGSLTSDANLERQYEIQPGEAVHGEKRSLSKYSPFLIMVQVPDEAKEELAKMQYGGYNVGGTVGPKTQASAEFEATYGGLATSVANQSLREWNPAFFSINMYADIWDQLLNIHYRVPPLVLLINPNDMTINYAKKQNHTERTRYGYIYQEWGEELVTLSFTGTIGAFYAGASTTQGTNYGSFDQDNPMAQTTSPTGNQEASRKYSASYQNLMNLMNVYLNNGYIRDRANSSPLKPSLAHHMIGSILICYDGFQYEGHFDKFEFKYEEKSNRGGLTYSFDFTCTRIKDVEPTANPVHWLKKLSTEYTAESGGDDGFSAYKNDGESDWSDWGDPENWGIKTNVSFEKEDWEDVDWYGVFTPNRNRQGGWEGSPGFQGFTTGESAAVGGQTVTQNTLRDLGGTDPEGPNAEDVEDVEDAEYEDGTEDG